MPGQDDLGTTAVGTIRAARDYEIPDETETQRRKEDAISAQRPVFDYDDTAGRDMGRVQGAFQLMRQGLASAFAPQPVTDPRHRDRRTERERLNEYFQGQEDTFKSRLQMMDLRDEDFAALEDSRFSELVEQELVKLVHEGLRGKVVPDLSDLHADRGLVIRSSNGESVEDDIREIRDLAGAKEDVERAGAGLPPTFGPRLRGALIHIATTALRPTLVSNESETRRRALEAANRVAPVVISVKRGERVISDGERVDKRHLLIFEGIRAQTRSLDVLSARIGGAVLTLLLVLMLWGYARRCVAAFRPARKDAVLLGLLYLGTLGLSMLGLSAGDTLHNRFAALSPESFYYLIPFAAGAMLVRSVLTAEIALLFSVAAGASVGLLVGHSLFFALHAMITSVAASGLVARTRDRRDLFKVGAGVGALGALLVIASYFFAGRASGDFSTMRFGLLRDLGASAAAAFVSGAFFLPVLVSLGLPVIETVFGYVTDVKLLELATLNHPALKELIVQAPGTYHHSIIMGTLVESAASAIGANALLARVSAYYHDIGKIRNPLYFAENQRGENRHEQLAPSMSALIVKRHVTDGLELAARWRLPKVVAEAIPQHHGTRFVSYFWAKAQKASETPVAGRAQPHRVEDGPDESLYRYAGPKPQTRENALVMIADACEASARALTEPTADRLRTLVQKRINEIFSEGQLDECELTLKDLNAIAGAMVRALEAIYHSRPEYPGRPQSDKERASPIAVVVSKGQG